MPDDPGPGDVAFAIHSTQNVRPISPYIYGMNFFANSSLTNPVMLDRLGGNRWTGYNWETNASNAGADYYHHSDYYLGSGPPGNAVLGSLQSAAANDRGLIVTVPMAGYVSADVDGTVDETEIAPSARWHAVVPNKETIYPGSALSLAPNESDGYVFTDEFVNWVEQTREPGQPVFYSLDNEPALWGETLPPGWQSGIENVLSPSPEGRTHPTIHPFEPTYAEMRDKTVAHAGAIKDVNPDAVVIGGVGYGWLEAVSLQNAPNWDSSPSHPGGDRPGELHYYEWLLNEIAQEEAAQGRTLVDVIDLHWYPEARGGGQRIVFGGGSSPALVEARVQAPRSLWDETYEEDSWITDCCSGGPIMLLPHLQRDIDDFKPGTKIAVTEYNYGGTNHISGAIAQADVLGIFAQEDVFAATFWSLQGDSGSQFASGAFKMYLDFDGAGGSFGDSLIAATTDDIATSSVYASVDSDDPNHMVIVAINRTGEPQDAAIAVEHDRIFNRAEVYQLTAATPNPLHAMDFDLDLVNAFIYTMPAFSVSTLVLISEGLSGDYNNNGVVDAGDYAVWLAALGGTELLNDPTPGTVDQSDYAYWKAHFGETLPGSGSASDAVPEPATEALLLFVLATLANRCRRNRR